MQSLDDTVVAGTHVTGIQSSQVDAVWHLAEPHLARAMENGTGDLTLADIRERLRHQFQQLWLAYMDGEVAGACVTEIAVWPTSKVVRVVALGGREGREWGFDLLNMVEAWARYMGARAVEVQGREGWMRVLAPRGYTQPYVVLRKEI